VSRILGITTTEQVIAEHEVDEAFLRGALDEDKQALHG
jgi:hypothetical protein